MSARKHYATMPREISRRVNEMIAPSQRSVQVGALAICPRCNQAFSQFDETYRLCPTCYRSVRPKKDPAAIAA